MPDPFEIIDSLSELVYVADVETHDLLYVNEPTADMIAGDWHGRKCHEALQNSEVPCSFCNNALLSRSKIYSWSCYNEQFGRHYSLKDRLVDWDGRLARFEIAFDVTEEIEHKNVLETQLKFETLLVECIIGLQGADGTDLQMLPIFAKIGEHMEADRVYLFQAKSATLMDNLYEWCAPGVEPQKEELQDVPIDFIDRWLPVFEQRDCVIIKDLEEIKESSPDEYAILRPQNIATLVTAPIVLDGKMAGFLGVDNPAPGSLEHCASFFKTLGIFLSMELERNQVKDQLRRMGFEDALTGLGNRNRFINDMEIRDSAESQAGYGVLFLDLNGLKDTNDLKGHAAGDRMLVQAADALRTAFPQSDLYRVGGDEFLAVTPFVSEQSFRKSVEIVRASLDAQRCSSAMGAYYAVEPCLLDKAVRLADSRMYADKRAFYQGVPRVDRHGGVQISDVIPARV